MFLVGDISENKEIVKVLKKRFDKKKVDFTHLDLTTIENFKNVKFDIMLISNLKKYEKSDNLKKILSNASITVINADVKENLGVLDNLKGTVITYGFNSKATITASSVNDSNISICIQRAIENVEGKMIEPIEYVENIENLKNIEISDIIGIKTIENLLTKRKINQI